MKVTINEVKPIPPPKTYTLELSQEEMDLLRYATALARALTLTAAAAPALNRFLNLTSNCAGGTWNHDKCFKS